jgi:protocatechuate 3,4-dioxygenase beta subunit
LDRGHIQGRVFGDLNGNGKEDAGESGIAGMSVRIDDKRSVITDSKGDFTFGSLQPGDVDVELTSEDLGVKLRASNPTQQHVSLSARHTVNLAFGLTSSGFAAGRVFNDLLLTGEQAAGVAPGLPGVKIILQRAEAAADSKPLTQVVDGDGLYEFRNIAPGKYLLEIDTATLPANFRVPTQTSWPITVNPLQGIYLDIPLAAQRAVSGTVYMDFDGDGKFSSENDTPIPGAFVRIGQAEAITDNTGSFILRNIVAGKAEIRAGTTRGYASRAITIELPASPSMLRGVDLAISASQAVNLEHPLPAERQTSKLTKN